MRAVFPIGHDDAGDDHRADEDHEAGAQPGQLAEQDDGEVPDLRRGLLQHAGEVGGRLQPEAMHGLADQRPLGHRVCGWRNMQGAALQRGGSFPGRFHQRTAEQVHRHQQDGQPDQRQQRRRTPVVVPQISAQAQVQRVEGDGQDQRPEHQVEEWVEHLVAEHDQHQDQTGADQHVQQTLGSTTWHRHGKAPFFLSRIRPRAVDHAERGPHWNASGCLQLRYGKASELQIALS
ncbi:hypothetical protein D3C81_1502150 [compost metagenome]